jgi:hypothetical protein
MKIQMSVAMKLMTATKRNQCVPDSHAGEAHAMQTMPNSCKQKATTGNYSTRVHINFITNCADDQEYHLLGYNAV